MIDIKREALIPLFRCPSLRHLPRRRRGKRPHLSTWYRGASRGLRGVRLETVRVGGTLCTSLPAIQRFFDALAPKPGGAGPPPHPPEPDAGRVERELDRLLG